MPEHRTGREGKWGSRAAIDGTSEVSPRRLVRRNLALHGGRRRRRSGDHDRTQPRRRRRGRRRDRHERTDQRRVRARRRKLCVVVDEKGGVLVSHNPTAATPEWTIRARTSTKKAGSTLWPAWPNGAVHDRRRRRRRADRDDDKPVRLAADVEPAHQRRPLHRHRRRLVPDDARSASQPTKSAAWRGRRAPRRPRRHGAAAAQPRAAKNTGATSRAPRRRCASPSTTTATRSASSDPTAPAPRMARTHRSRRRIGGGDLVPDDVAVRGARLGRRGRLHDRPGRAEPAWTRRTPTGGERRGFDLLRGHGLLRGRRRTRRLRQNDRTDRCETGMERARRVRRRRLPDARSPARRRRSAWPSTSKAARSSRMIRRRCGSLLDRLEIDPGRALRSVSCTSAMVCGAVDEAGRFLTTTEAGAATPAWSAPGCDRRPRGLTAVSCAAATLCAGGRRSRAGVDRDSRRPAGARAGNDDARAENDNRHSAQTDGTFLHADAAVRARCSSLPSTTSTHASASLTLKARCTQLVSGTLSGKVTVGKGTKRKTYAFAVGPQVARGKQGDHVHAEAAGTRARRPRSPRQGERDVQALLLQRERHQIGDSEDRRAEVTTLTAPAHARARAETHRPPRAPSAGGRPDAFPARSRGISIWAVIVRKRGATR